MILLEELKGIEELPAYSDGNKYYDNICDDTTLAFVCNGGAGNQFVLMNFIYCISRFLANEPVKINIYASNSKNLNEFLSTNQSFIDEIHPWSDSPLGLNSDVLVELDFFPFVLQERVRVKSISPKLHNLLDKWRDFTSDSKIRWGRIHPDENSYVYECARKTGHNNLNIMDVDGTAQIGRDFTWHPHISDEEHYSKLGLKKDGYITIQRGATPEIKGDASPKLWSLDSYKELVRLIHATYPNKKIVQVGQSDNSEAIDGIDTNLLDKTTWDELASVLKNSWLHIDGECGMVHLRASITDRPSVVLFGSTPRFFYGYDKNINLRSDTCKDGCARENKDWQTRCAKGYKTPLCMNSLTPAYVLENISLWDRLQMIKDGEIKAATVFKNAALMSDSRIKIDKDYAADFLFTYHIIYYEIVKIPISSLKVCYFSEDGLKHISVSETKAYKSLINDDMTIYSDYVDTQRQRDNNTILSVERFKGFIKDMEENGYDTTRMIITDDNNVVLDGQHRAAWLAYKHGTDTSIDILKIYTLNTNDIDFFPFDKVTKDSRVIIYGMGAAGKSYINQIEKTKYCEIIGIMDKNENECIDYKWINPKYMNLKMLATVDHIIIASRNKRHINEMYENLRQNGVDANKIVCHKFGII